MSQPRSNGCEKPRCRMRARPPEQSNRVVHGCRPLQLRTRRPEHGARLGRAQSERAGERRARAAGEIVEHVEREGLKLRARRRRVAEVVERPGELEAAGREHSGAGRRGVGARVGAARLAVGVGAGPGEQSLDCGAARLPRSVPLIADHAGDRARRAEARPGEPCVGEPAGDDAVVGTGRADTQAGEVLLAFEPAFGSWGLSARNWTVFCVGSGSGSSLAERYSTSVRSVAPA